MIGLFDSGLGGLTILRELTHHLPREGFIYLADTAGLPYGNKSPDVIRKRALENAGFLLSQGIKLLVIACFTASIHALEELQQKLPIPVIGMIPSHFEGILSKKRLALLGTASTIQSGVLQTLIRKQNPSIEIASISCPLFVPFIEEGLSDHPALCSIADHYLAQVKGVDSALLACTHYPLIRPLIQEALGPQADILEGGSWVIPAVKELSTPKEKGVSCHHFFVTADPSRFATIAPQFLGFRIDRVELLAIEKNGRI